jgi:hypothetical protein
VRNLDNINLKLDFGNVLPSELTTPTSGFGKAWNNVLREFDTVGVKITDARANKAGTEIKLPVAIHAAT